MTLELGALLICVAVFAVGLYRGVNVGILLFVAAAAVGVGLAQIPVKEVIDGFPTDLLILLVGVTFFFGVAQVNGTVDRLIDSALRKVGDRTALLPLAFFGLNVAVASMGNPGAALVVIPIGMNVAHKKGIEPMMMAVALGTGMSAGGFAPTSTFGIIINGTATKSDIYLNPLLLFGIALVVNLVLLAIAYSIFGRRLFGANTSATEMNTSEKTFSSVASASNASTSRGVGDHGPTTGGHSHGVPTPTSGSGGGFVADSTHRGPLTTIQKITVVCLVSLVGIVLAASLLDMNPDIGVLTFSLAAILILLDPKAGKAGAQKIDWSTVLLVGGIITYVTVLQKVGTIDMLGNFAADMSIPLLAALLICVVAGLVSAFASTIGMLAVLVPLAIPLVASGSIPGWAMICAIGICASIVDQSPFSSSGATMIATAPDPADHPRLTKLLMRWGMTLVVVGPIVMIGTLVVPPMIF